MAALAVVVLACGFGIGYAVALGLGNAPISQCSETYLVTRVIDGDTVEIADGSRVRYLGVDTPELGEPYADEATDFNRQMVESAYVQLEASGADTDAYGRLLRYVYVDGTFVNAQLVAQGYATAYIFDPHDPYSQVLVQLEQYAKGLGRGIWADGAP